MHRWRGGPAVLIVAGSDTDSLNAFFFKLYANILHNRPLEEAVSDAYDAYEQHPSSLRQNSYQEKQPCRRCCGLSLRAFSSQILG